ncbi:MAG: PLP-dependent aminotransferase family protein [Acidobacteriia bacterium]|nr:PLP-dependent aminotransferase family protein [Terriglobia bacterium]
MNPDDMLSRDARGMRSSLIRQLTGLVNQPHVISFAAGSPNAETFPHEKLRQILHDLVERERGHVFQYSVTRGNAQLINAVCERDRSLKGIESTPAETLLASGSQQGLDFIARVLLDPGDAVLVETPSFIGAMSSFENFRAKLFAVECDEDGMDMGHLAQRIAEARSQGRQCKLIYVVPNFQNPAGTVWSQARRQALCDLSRHEGVVVVEDDAYGELYFDGIDPEALAPIKSCADSNHVIYVSTFSKILAPGLRVAWMHGPAEIIQRIEYCKETGDLCTPTHSQRLVLEFLERGWMPAQAALARNFYAAKSKTMQTALGEHFSGLARWHAARGGLFQWLDLPEGIDALGLLHDSLEQDQVAFIPGGPFFAESGRSNALRLSFSNVRDENIDIGLSRLSRRIRQALA